MARIANNLLWMLTERGLQVGAGIAIVAMLARALGPEGFAHFQYAQAVVVVASSVALICSGEVVVPRLVLIGDVGTRHRLLAHAFCLRIGGATLGYLIAVLYLWLAGAPNESLLIGLVLGITILLREPFGIVIAWMQARTHNRPSTLFNICSLSIKAGLVVLLFWAGSMQPTLYAVPFALEQMVLAALLITYYRARVPHRAVRIDPILTRELASSGALFWMSFMMQMCTRRVDQLILHPLVTSTDYAAYAACMQILDNYTVFATILAAGIAPIYVYSKTSADDAHRNIGRVTFFMGGIGLAGALLIATGSDWIAHLIYGSSFAQTGPLLRVAAFASVLVFIEVAMTLLPVYLRKPGWIAWKWAITLAVTVAFDLLAIPAYGIWGAVAGYGLGNGVAAVIGVGVWWWHGRRRPLLVL